MNMKQLVSIAIVVLGGSVPLLAQQAQSTDEAAMQDAGGAGHWVKFALPTGSSSVYYPNDTSCSDNTHKTRYNHWYAHLHISITFPTAGITATDKSTGATVTLTPAAIDKWWDWYYGVPNSGNGNSGTTGVSKRDQNGYTRVSGTSADLSYNCFGYAINSKTWVNDPTYIMSDELTSASGWSDSKFLLESSTPPQHIIVVSSYKPGEWWTTEGTCEKDAESGIYTNSWTYTSPNNADLKYKLR